MAKNQMTTPVGMAALQQRLAGAKKNKAMKPPMMRPKTSSNLVKKAM